MTVSETAPSPAGSPFWRFSLRLYRSPGVAEACITLQEESGADTDSAIRNIERREIMSARIDFDEIGNGPVNNAIVEISEGSAEDTGQTDPQHQVGCAGAGRLPKQHRYEYEHAGRKSDEEEAPPGSGGIGEQTKRDARIFRVDDVEETGDDAEGLLRANVAFNDPFGEAVQKKNGSGEGEG